MIHLSTAWRRARRMRRRSRIAVAAATVVGTAVAMLAGAPFGNAHPGQPSPVFDPNEVGWAGLRDRTVTEFDDDLRKWADRGHLVVDLEADTFSGELRLGGAFQVNTDKRGWLVDTVMTAAEYNAKFEDARQRGLRLVDRELYSLDGVRHYAAAWVQNVEGLGWHTKHDLTYAQLQSYFREQQEARRMPIDFDMYRASDGTVRYGLIWLDNPENLGWRLHGDLTSAGYAAKFDEYDAAGFRMLSFDSAPASSTQLYGGIWVENANHRGWKGRRDMTATGYGNWWHRYADLGYRQIFVGRYQTAGGVSYASLWRQNNDRPDWRLRPDVDRVVETEMAVDDIPGVTVAVMQGGEIRYSRGFGYADIGAGVWLDSSHVMRTASISKAVGGALTLRLDEAGVLDRTDLASEHITDLPAHHTSTLEHLASNRGCVRHYADPDSAEAQADPEEYAAQEAVDDSLGETVFATNTEASLLYRDDPLLLNCTVGTDERYSTFGYGLLASAEEQATGLTASQLVRQYISDPLGLTTLRQEDTTDTTVNRPKLYAGADNDEIGYDEMSWKTLGGGLESDVRDVASFGDHLMAGDIVSQDSLDHMWVDLGWDYAYGWKLLADHNGHRRVGKSGGGPGADSYLLMYPDDGVTIAVLINREELAEDDNNAWQIANGIGELMF
jgi:CubicO group peptidase (beta-lactamase class C family)